MTTCPQCGSGSFRPSQTRSFMELVMLRFVVPVRCINCKYRFKVSPRDLEEAQAQKEPVRRVKDATPESDVLAGVSPEAPAEVSPEITAEASQKALPAKTKAAAPEKPAVAEPAFSPDEDEILDVEGLPLLVVEPSSGSGWKWIAALLVVIVIGAGAYAFTVRRARSQAKVEEIVPPIANATIPSAPAPVPASGPGLGAGTKSQTRINPADGLPYVYIAPGRFTMGCSPGDGYCESDEKPHAESIDSGFWLGQTEVTQAAWKRVNHGSNPSHFKGDDLPVESVNWDDAAGYCKAVGGRLPTEKEWEYAARGESTGAIYGPPGEIAWYAGNSAGTTHPVGRMKPNAFGLYDMLGNVWEWTADNYNDRRKSVRGGSWSNGINVLRVSYRERGEPNGSSVILGFRCLAEAR